MRLTYSLPNVSSQLAEGKQAACLEEYEDWFSSGLREITWSLAMDKHRVHLLPLIKSVATHENFITVFGSQQEY